MIGLQQPIYIMSGYGSFLEEYIFNRFVWRQCGDVMIYSQMFCILRLQSWTEMDYKCKHDNVTHDVVYHFTVNQVNQLHHLQLKKMQLNTVNMMLG